jgi:hypothetical protein
MKKTILLLITLALLFVSCRKVIEGHKILNINFSNAKTGEAIDSIHCFIGQPLWTSYRVITDALSDKNGNCKLEVDYKSSDHYYFAIKKDYTFSENRVFTYRGNHFLDKYRVIGIPPFVNLREKNEFNLKIQLIPLIKLVTTFEFGKTYNGFPMFEIFENNESIYSTLRGGRVPNNLWLVTDKDSVDCYVSSIEKTKYVYSFLSNEGKTVFSKSIIIDPKLIVDKTIHVKFD